MGAGAGAMDPWLDKLWLEYRDSKWALTEDLLQFVTKYQQVCSIGHRQGIIQLQLIFTELAST